MSKMLAVLLNGIAQLEYDRDTPLPLHQAAYLDRMDEKMDAGILADGQKIANPDTQQRAQFVAANLVHALNTGDETMAAAMCTYLAVRFPELKQVRIKQHGEEVSIELDFEQEYRKQVAVDFIH